MHLALILLQRMEFKRKKNEERYGWLVDVRDENGKRPSDPDYDPTTLRIFCGSQSIT